MSLNNIPGLPRVVHVAPRRRLRRTSAWVWLLMFLVGVIVGQAAQAIYPLDALWAFATQMWRTW